MPSFYVELSFDDGRGHFDDAMLAVAGRRRQTQTSISSCTNSTCSCTRAVTSA
jgi:hypothetical protein